MSQPDAIPLFSPGREWWCPKCLCMDRNLEYRRPSHRDGNIVVPEHLSVRCDHCGYSENMRCADFQSQPKSLEEQAMEEVERELQPWRSDAPSL